MTVQPLRSLRQAMSLALFLSSLLVLATDTAANNIIVLDDDGRIIQNTTPGPIETVGPSFGLSSEDIKRARATIGKIYCRSGNMIYEGTGFLIAKRVLLTAAHLFVDEQGAIRVRPGQCFFRNFDRKTQITIPVEIDSRHLKLYTRDTKREWGKDLAAILLEHSPTVESPFPSDSAGRTLAHRERMIAIAAIQDGANADNSQPIAQLCTHRNWADAGQFSFQIEYSDCTSQAGSSGSLILVRLNGSYVARSLVLGGGRAALDGKPYNIDNGSYTYSITLTPQLVSDIMHFARSLAR